MTGGENSNSLNARLTAETLDTYFRAGSVVAVNLSDEPHCTLRIDPLHERVELWTPALGPEPAVESLSRLSISTETLEDGPWFALAVDARGAHLEAYSLLAAVVDNLLSGRPFHVAVSNSVDTFRELLSRRGRLSEERVVGLIGELLVLQHLIETTSEEYAVSAWLGPSSEEHDFVLAELDAEVKTTLSERRSHIIGSETQLETSPSRPLWLVSIQLTRAGNAPDGFTLGEVIERLRATLTTTAFAVNSHLGTLGWRDPDVDLYRESYMPRTKPRAYLVDRDFPAITRARLEENVPQTELVGPVSYRVDVTGIKTTVPIGGLSGFVEGTNV